MTSERSLDHAAVDDWDELAEWWIATVRDDPAESDEMLEVLRLLVDPTARRTLDLGCGDGQAFPLLGDGVVGVDLSHRLLSDAVRHAPVVRARLPGLSWVRHGSVDQAVAIGVLELLPEHDAFFEEVAAAVRPTGSLVVVMNHPVVTAPHSDPLVDDAGEILWRWGRYLDRGTTPQTADDRTVELHHRPLGDLLTTAAGAGWRLEEMVERGPTPYTVAAQPHHHGHEHLPSVLGVRWRRDPTVRPGAWTSAPRTRRR